MPRNRKQKKAAAAAAAASGSGAAGGAGGAASSEGPGAPLKAKGNEAFAKGEYDVAIDRYTEAIELEPENKVYYSNRSAALVAFGSKATQLRALEDADKCIELDDTWPKGYYRKALALKALNRYGPAREALIQGRALQPDNADFEALHEQLSKVKLADGMHDEVEEEGDGDKFDQMEKWLLDGGAKFPLLYMKRYAENNRGVHCRVNIPPEREIMRIPQQFLITVEMGKAHPIGQKMLRYNVDVSATKHCYIAVYTLLDRKDPTSFYQPYYNILPTHYDNMPIFWDAEQLGWLEGSYLLTQISDRKKNIAADYEEIQRAAPEFGDEATLEEFSWARMMVASRNFGVKIDDVKTDALVPYADMLNHYRPRETRWTFDQSLHSFTITTIKELKAGQQIYDSYGKKCNSRFLLNYGFAVENNRDPEGQCHNEVRQLFVMRPAEEDRYFSQRVGLLDGGATERSIRVGSWYDHKSTLEAFSFLRFIYAEAEELMVLPQIGDDYDLGDNPIKPISCENEIQVLEHMARLMREQYERYPTTIEEDQATLDSGEFEPFSNHRNVIVVLRGEKEVCLHYMKLAEVCIPMLRQEWKDVKKAIQKKWSGRGDIEAYIKAVVQPLVKRKGSKRVGGAALGGS